MPPHQLGPLVARQVGRLDGGETSLFLQDYGQVWLVPLPGDGPAAGEPQSIDGSDVGRAVREARPVEVPQADGVRIYLPLLDRGDQVGVMAVTLDRIHDDERRLLRRLASLVADMLVTKHGYTDLFFRLRRREPRLTDALPSVVGAVVGALLLHVLVGRLLAARRSPASGTATEEVGNRLPPAAGWDRQGFVLAAASAAMASAAVGAVGRSLTASRGQDAIASRQGVALPFPGSPAQPVPRRARLRVPGISLLSPPTRTSTEWTPPWWSPRWMPRPGDCGSTAKAFNVPGSTPPTTCCAGN